MSDYSGFRPVYTLGEETEAMSAASYAVMNRTRANRAVNSSRCVNTSSKHKITKREYLGTAKNVIKNIGMAYSGYIAQELSKPISIAFNRAMRRAGQYIVIPGSKIAKGASIGFTVFGITDTVLSIRNNFRNSKSLGEAWGRTGIDVLSITLSAVAGALTSPVGGVAIGTGIGLFADLAKNYLWDEQDNKIL